MQVKLYVSLFLFHSVCWISCCLHADETLSKFPAPCGRLNRPALDSLGLKFWYCVLNTHLKCVHIYIILNFFQRCRLQDFDLILFLISTWFGFLGSDVSISDFRIAFLLAYNLCLSFGVTCYLSGPESPHQKKEGLIWMTCCIYLTLWCLIVCYPITRWWIVFISVMLLKLHSHD